MIRNIGYMVWLKSGSPAMMVCGWRPLQNLIEVEWFDENGLHRDCFYEINLMSTDPNNPRTAAINEKE